MHWKTINNNTTTIDGCVSSRVFGYVSQHFLSRVTLSPINRTAPPTTTTKSSIASAKKMDDVNSRVKSLTKQFQFKGDDRLQWILGLAAFPTNKRLCVCVCVFVCSGRLAHLCMRHMSIAWPSVPRASVVVAIEWFAADNNTKQSKFHLDKIRTLSTGWSCTFNFSYRTLNLPHENTSVFLFINAFCNLFTIPLKKPNKNKNKRILRFRKQKKFLKT